MAATQTDDNTPLTRGEFRRALEATSGHWYAVNDGKMPLLCRSAIDAALATLAPEEPAETSEYSGRGCDGSYLFKPTKPASATGAGLPPLVRMDGYLAGTTSPAVRLSTARAYADALAASQRECRELRERDYEFRIVHSRDQARAEQAEKQVQAERSINHALNDHAAKAEREREEAIRLREIAEKEGDKTAEIARVAQTQLSYEIRKRCDVERERDEATRATWREAEKMLREMANGCAATHAWRCALSHAADAIAAMAREGRA